MSKGDDANNERQEWATTLAVAGLAAIPAVGGPLAVIADRVLEQRQEGAREAGETAVAFVGDAQHLVEAVRDDERLAALLVETAETAARTTLSEKRRMLGVVVGRAVLDSARIDESELAAAALRELDRPHLHCLEAVARVEDELTGQEAKNASDAVAQVASNYPVPVHSALIRHGCVHPTTHLGGGTGIYRVTPFGRYLLNDVRAAAGDLA